jgi:hypothetical protein
MLTALGDHPTPAQILDIELCDPAMGAGAFLVEACRQLADHLARAHDFHHLPHHGRPAPAQIAQHCLYGVDRDPLAVAAARLSLALLTGADDPLREISATATAWSASPAPTASRSRRRRPAHSSPPTPRAAGPVLPFHWPHEYPHVFTRENPGFDCIVGNPPFLGGKRISTVLGPRTRDWLARLHGPGTGNADLAAHFLRRAFTLLRRRRHPRLHRHQHDHPGRHPARRPVPSLHPRHDLRRPHPRPLARRRRRDGLHRPHRPRPASRPGPRRTPRPAHLRLPAADRRRHGAGPARRQSFHELHRLRPQGRRLHLRRQQSERHPVIGDARAIKSRPAQRRDRPPVHRRRGDQHPPPPISAPPRHRLRRPLPRRGRRLARTIKDPRGEGRPEAPRDGPRAGPLALVAVLADPRPPARRHRPPPARARQLPGHRPPRLRVHADRPGVRPHRQHLRVRRRRDVRGPPVARARGLGPHVRQLARGPPALHPVGLLRDLPAAARMAHRPPRSPRPAAATTPPAKRSCTAATSASRPSTTISTPRTTARRTSPSCADTTPTSTAPPSTPTAGPTSPTAPQANSGPKARAVDRSATPPPAARACAGPNPSPSRS